MGDKLAAMAPIKRIERSATITFSPAGPYLAAGSVAGAIDLSFSASSVLEIFDVDLANPSLSVKPAAPAVQAPERFARLGWSKAHGPYKRGVIAGGLADGSIVLWDAARLLRRPSPAGAAVAPQDAVLARLRPHEGPVRGLEFSPSSPHLLATGAADGVLRVWDLTDAANPKPFFSAAGAAGGAAGADAAAPAPAPGRGDPIVQVAWNRRVPHVLCAAAASGAARVWDLKKRRLVIALRDDGGAGAAAAAAAASAAAGGAAGPRRASAVAWNPDVATQLLLASDDDARPEVALWDLRNARAPVRALRGHRRGVAAVAWCPHDPRFAISVSRDRSALLWDVPAGRAVAVVGTGEDWAFDVRWSPKSPGIFAAPTFEGGVALRSVDAAPAPDGAAPGDRPAPRWLAPRAAVAFGFGGRLARAGAALRPEGAGDDDGGAPAAGGAPAPRAPPSTLVEVLRVRGDDELAAAAERFVADLGDASPARALALCAGRAEDPARPDAELWALLGARFEDDPRRALLDRLGYAQAEDARLERQAAEADEEEREAAEAAAQLAEAADADGLGGAAGACDGAAAAAAAGGADGHAPDGAPDSAREGRGDADLAELDANGADAFFDDDDDEDAAAGAAGRAEGEGEGEGEGPDGGAAAARGSPRAADGPGAARLANGKASPPLASPLARLSLGGVGSPRARGPAQPGPGEDDILVALRVGDASGAAEAAAAAGRFADALAIAALAGGRVWDRAQKAYLAHSRAPYARVLEARLGAAGAWDAYARRQPTAEWRGSLALLLSSCPPEEFAAAAAALAETLDAAGEAEAAALVRVAAGDLDGAVAAWAAQAADEQRRVLAGETGDPGAARAARKGARDAAAGAEGASPPSPLSPLESAAERAVVLALGTGAAGDCAPLAALLSSLGADLAGAGRPDLAAALLRLVAPAPEDASEPAETLRAALERAEGAEAAAEGQDDEPYAAEEEDDDRIRAYEGEGEGDAPDLAGWDDQDQGAGYTAQPYDAPQPAAQPSGGLYQAAAQPSGGLYQPTSPPAPPAGQAAVFQPQAGPYGGAASPAASAYGRSPTAAYGQQAGLYQPAAQYQPPSVPAPPSQYQPASVPAPPTQYQPASVPAPPTQYQPASVPAPPTQYQPASVPAPPTQYQPATFVPPAAPPTAAYGVAPPPPQPQATASAAPYAPASPPAATYAPPPPPPTSAAPVFSASPAPTYGAPGAFAAQPQAPAAPPAYAPPAPPAATYAPPPAAATYGAPPAPPSSSASASTLAVGAAAAAAAEDEPATPQYEPGAFGVRRAASAAGARRPAAPRPPEDVDAATVDVSGAPGDLERAAGTLQELFRWCEESSANADGSRPAPIADAAKRVGRLLWLLNAGAVSDSCSRKIARLAAALEVSDWSAVQTAQVEMTSADWDEARAWLPALKRLLKMRQTAEAQAEAAEAAAQGQQQGQQW